jgi:RNA polymerase sigma-70 factor (ECF subfamily)
MDRSSESMDQQPSAERVIDARRLSELVARRLLELPERTRRILLRHRIDGISQRAIAAEFGVSQSTIESDLRLAYRFLDMLRREIDEEKPR